MFATRKRVLVIGATGHIGGYLVPGLVAEGHEVTTLSRNPGPRFRPDPAWNRVTQVSVDREAEEASGTFADTVATLNPDVVIDLICFTERSARQLVDGVRDRVELLVHVGTIWVHGTLTEVPATEAAPRQPWGDYGIQKAAIERFLLNEAKNGLPATIVHPGHISGPGWEIVNPQGTPDPSVWRALALGDELLLPAHGLATVHHVHAEDVADLIRRCIADPSNAAGESFHAVSPQALTLRGLAETAAGWFGQRANLRFTEYSEFESSVEPSHRDAAFQHIARSHSMSMAKAKQRLGFTPHYTSLQAVAESVDWLIRDGRVGDSLPPFRPAFGPTPSV